MEFSGLPSRHDRYLREAEGAEPSKALHGKTCA
jgi:hypothetical protein